MIISLAGFMGCGKSSVGRELAALLSCSFTDLDEYIEQREGRTIPEIFSSDGEPAFRAMELSALSSVVMSMPLTSGKKSVSGIDLPPFGQCHGHPEEKIPGQAGNDRNNGHSAPDAESHRQPYSPLLVLSLGGGTVTTPECANIVAAHTTCIYLRATTDTLVRNLQDDYQNRPMLIRASGHSTEEIPGQAGNDGNNGNASSLSSRASAEGSEPDAESLLQLRARIGDLMQKRSAIYESTAHHIIDIDGKSFSEIAEEIRTILR